MGGVLGWHSCGSWLGNQLRPVPSIPGDVYYVPMSRRCESGTQGPHGTKADGERLGHMAAGLAVLIKSLIPSLSSFCNGGNEKIEPTEVCDVEFNMKFCL